jgi:hypothetical protein
MEKVMTETNLLGKLQNILNMDESGVQACKESDSLTAENGHKSFHVLTS